MKKNIFPIIISALFLCTFIHSQNQVWPILKHYDQDHLLNISLPLGGIGTGTVGLGGRGELRDWEIMNIPGIGYNTVEKGSNDAPFFAIYVKPHGEPSITRALIGPVLPTEYEHAEGRSVNNHGLPRFSQASFDASYPVGIVHLSDPSLPIKVKIIGFNPFVPCNAEASGLPIAVLTYEITNLTDKPMEVSVCGSMRNFIGRDGSKFYRNWKGDIVYTGDKDNQNIFKKQNGISGIFMYSDSVPRDDAAWGTIALSTKSDKGIITYRRSSVSNDWERALLDFWDDFSANGDLTDKKRLYDDDPMASLAVKKTIAPKSKASFRFFLTWDFPNRYAWSKKIVGNYYSTEYNDAWDAAQKIIPQIPVLEKKTHQFLESFLHSSLPEAVKEAALFNLSTLRSQTVFRIKDGHMMGWEGVFDHNGSCYGSCTHVWNYEVATNFLFGNLSKTMCDVEFNSALDTSGLMCFRAGLPLSEACSVKKAAADGQMGTIMKFYLQWQLSGDNMFLKQYWTHVKKALAFAWVKGGWDANQDGVMEGCQSNTMDIEYYGPNPQEEFWYLGALKACEKMASYLKDKDFEKKCHTLFESGKAWTDAHLFNGEYYIQLIQPPKSQNDIYPGLQAGMGCMDISNPDFQLGNGCLVDQLVGQYMSHICGLGYLGNQTHIRTALRSIMRYNYVQNFSPWFNNMRSFVMGNESGLIMASWPHGRLKVPFPYFAESMTGFEYTAAIGMIYEGQIAKGLKCVQSIRARFDGLKRNPYDEPECGHFYARSLASWSSVIALSGFHFSAIDKSMTFTSNPGTYFWSNGYAWGICKIEGRTATLTVIQGEVQLVKFTLKGTGTKKLNNVIIRKSQSIQIQL